MAQTQTPSQTIREIPLSKLVRSEANVRRTNPAADIEALAASIAAHGLLQSLSVRPQLDGKGKETGRFAVSGGGRRLAALNLLAKQKRIPKAQPVPCIVNDGDEEEVSLAENVMREALHPADQFEAFKTLSAKEMSAEDIGARFGVSAHVVRQRLRLASVSPKLLAVFRQGDLTLEQMTAFAITDDHERQEQVFEALPEWDRDARSIRSALMEAHVSGGDKRARFVGIEAYQAAGGGIVRDLFAEGDAIYLSDITLLDRLTMEKLIVAARAITAEGWKWVEAYKDYPHSHGLRRIHAEPAPLSTEQQERLDACEAERDALVEPYEAGDDMPDDVVERHEALEAEIERLSERQFVFPDDAVAFCGAFVSLGRDGTVQIDRGFIRRDDERALAKPDDGEPEKAAPQTAPKLLSDALMRDLTAHRTMALRLAVGGDPGVALAATVHAMAADIFYRETDRSCLDVRAVSVSLDGWADGIADSPSALALIARHDVWAARVPSDLSDLWAFVAGLSQDEQLLLLAHCAALSIHAVKQPNDRRPQAFAVSDALASAVSLDMAQHWSPTVASYLGRVSKPQIIEAVREGVSAEAARKLDGLKKNAMADAAEKALAGRGWLPASLRAPVAAT